MSAEEMAKGPATRTETHTIKYQIDLGTLSVRFDVVDGVTSRIRTEQPSAMEGRSPPSAQQLADAAQLFAQAARDAGYKAMR